MNHDLQPLKAAEPKRIFLAIPGGADGVLALETHESIVRAGTDSMHNIDMTLQASSALTFNFNALLCKALNARMQGKPYDIFAMLHTDIAPEPNWIDKMVNIFDRTKADILSVVSPIKDEKGLTSTAIDTSRWTPRRLTMSELMTMPPTFDGDFIKNVFGAPLLLNTGLMFIRFTAAWATRICFSIDNVISERDGVFTPFFEPEDWMLSRWANREGLKLVATREVSLRHLGRMAYGNDEPWGSMQVDEINVVNSALGHRGLIPR